MSSERDTSLRILALNWRCVRHPQSGGAEKNLFEQAQRWVRDGHQVTIFCADPGRQVAPERDEVIDGVLVKRRGRQFTVYILAALFLLFKGRHFDRVLDVSNGIPFFAPLFTRKPAVLLIHHVHGLQWFSEFPRPVAAVGHVLESRVVPYIYRRNPIIAVSPTTRDALVELGIQASQVQVIYNGVEFPDTTANVRHDPHRIVYVGRLKRYKRLERLIMAIDDLRHEFPGIHLDIAGDGDARSELTALVKRLGLTQHVTLHGFVEDGLKTRLLASANVFVTPSMHEGWGLSVVEANAHGCPAVAYDVPGLRAAIRHDQTGLLADNDASFRDAIARLLRDAPLRSRFSDAAREWAKTFDWDSCAAQTLHLLRPARLGRVA